MIVDSSALLAILFGESGAERYLAAIVDDGAPRISAVSFVETAIVAENRYGPGGGDDLDQLIDRSGIEILPVSVDEGRLARAAYRNYGKRRHPAGLNFGDCFSYALARARNEPLLFQGDDFSQTDIEPAL